MKTKLLLVFMTVIMENVFGDFFDQVIDVDDILSENFMPSSLLMLENPESARQTDNRTIQTTDTNPVDALETDGSFGDAMETMNFHRNFLAEQIMSNLTVDRIERRMGHVTFGIGEETTPTDKLSVKRSLISDEGSSAYKDWLSKSATLEDIYRNFDQAQDKDDSGDDDEDNKEEELDEDYVPPIAKTKERNTVTLKHRGHGGEEIYYSAGGGGPYGGHDLGGGHSGYEGGPIGYGGGNSGIGEGHSGYGGGFPVHEPEGHFGIDAGPLPVHQPIYEPPPPKYQVHQVHNYYTKDKDLADLFEVALTALAFLAFKMFLVHVIMCISSVSYQSMTTVAPVIAMSMSPTATATGGMTGTGGGGVGDGMSGTGGGDAGIGNGMPDTGGDEGMTGTGGGDTAGVGGDDGMTDTGGGDGMTDMGEGDGMTDTEEGDGMTDTEGGDGMTDTGGGDSTGTETGDGGGGDDTEGGGTNEETGTGTGTATGTGTGGDTTGTADTATGGTGTADTATGGTGTGDTGTGDTDAGDTGTGGGRDSFKLRMKRRAPTANHADTLALNELARRVLTAMDSALIADSDNGECLRKSLCENNKWSRSLEGRSRIFVPVLSLGMSWSSGKLVKSIPSATSMLDALKASFLGLGNANCEIIYQKCDLKRQVIEARKKRRRKRSTN